MFSFKKFQLYNTKSQEEDPQNEMGPPPFGSRWMHSNSQRQADLKRSQKNTLNNPKDSHSTSPSSTGFNFDGMDPFLRNLAVENQSKQQEQVDKAVRQIQLSYTYGGNSVTKRFGFFHGLRKTLTPITSLAAKATMEQTIGLVQQAVSTLDSHAISSDGGQFDTQSKQQQFDKAVANLSGAMQKVSQASGGSAVVSQISNQIANLIAARDDIGRWDEALGNTILDGDSESLDKVAEGKDVDPSKLGKGSAILAVQVVSSLNEKKETGKAEDIVENIAKSAEKLEKANQKLTQRTGNDQQTLNSNIAGFGQLAGSEQQLRGAIEAQKKSHGTFDQLEALAGNSINIFNDLHKLSQEIPDSRQKKFLDQSIDNYAEVMPESAALSTSGSNAFTRLILEAEGLDKRKNNPTFFDRAVQGAKYAGKGSKALKSIANLYLSKEVKSLMEKATSGQLSQSSAQLNRLLGKASRLGLGDKEINEIVDSFETLKTSGNPEQALNNFKGKLDNTDVFDSTTLIGRSLGLAGVAIASINLVNNLPKREGFDFRSVVQTMSDSVGLGKAGLNLLSSNKKWVDLVSNKLNLAGKSLAAVGIAFSAKDTIESMKDGEWAESVVSGMGVTSGVLSLLGYGAAGFAVGLAAMAISFQMSRVKASNVLENEHTEAFLISLGISEETAHHLRNADSAGRSIGPVLVALLEYTGTSRSQMLKALVDLGPSHALELAEACHGVDPDGDGQFPTSDPYAQYAGRTKEELKSDSSINFQFGNANEQDADRPHSLEGLQNYITRRQLPIPVTSN